MKVFRKKSLIIIFAVLIVSALASASILTYFNRIDVVLNIKQSITIDGNNWDEPIIETFGSDAYGGDTFCFDHVIRNNGNKLVWLNLITDDLPEGVTITITSGSFIGSVLVANIDNDIIPYSIYIDGIKAGETEGNSGGSIIDITGEFTVPGTHRLTLQADQPITEPSLLVSFIGIYDTNGETVDNIILDNNMFFGRNPIGWSSVSSGCRYAFTETNNQSSIDTICESDELTQPFWVGPGQEYYIYICYTLDDMIEPGQYTITSHLVKA